MADIRRLGPDDLDALLSLYAHLHATDTALPGRGEVLAVWSELMSSARHPYFGLFEGDRLVGSCTLTIVPNLTRSCRPYGVIENVVTHPEFRGWGHGKAILAEALRHAWAQRCYKVMLLTGRKDEATLRFYEAAGFDRHQKQAFIANAPDDAS